MKNIKHWLRNEKENTIEIISEEESKKYELVETQKSKSLNMICYIYKKKEVER